MTLWRWTALAALGVIACAIGFGAVSGIEGCAGVANPIVVFEFVITPAQVEALFPYACRTAHIAAHTQALTLDHFVFIPVYAAFLILSLLALRREGQRWTAVGIGAVIVAALCDWFEGRQLLAILAALPGDQATIDLLIPAVRAKFALLAGVVMLIGWLHIATGKWRAIAGAVMVVASFYALLGVALSVEWVMRGSGIGWIALIVTTFALAVRNPQRDLASNSVIS